MLPAQKSAAGHAQKIKELRKEVQAEKARCHSLEGSSQAKLTQQVCGVAWGGMFATGTSLSLGFCLFVLLRLCEYSGLPNLALFWEQSKPD